MCTEMETSVDQDNNATENVAETSSNDDLLDQIPVPSLAPEERIISAVACNGGVSYTTVAPSELGAVPEEDEEAATSSTPSTVVSRIKKPLGINIIILKHSCSIIRFFSFFPCLNNISD